MIILQLKYLIETQIWIPSITTRNSFTNLSKVSESSSGDIAQHYRKVRSTDTCNVIYYLFTTDFKIRKNKEIWACVVLRIHFYGEGRSSEMSRQHTFLPTMSFLIASVIGIGLAASGEIYLVKVLTASRSIPTRKKYRIKLWIPWHRSKMRSE